MVRISEIQQFSYFLENLNYAFGKCKLCFFHTIHFHFKMSGISSCMESVLGLCHHVLFPVFILFHPPSGKANTNLGITLQWTVVSFHPGLGEVTLAMTLRYETSDKQVLVDWIIKADLHGTTLSHAICSRQVYDTSCFV